MGAKRYATISRPASSIPEPPVQALYDSMPLRLPHCHQETIPTKHKHEEHAPYTHDWSVDLTVNGVHIFTDTPSQRVPLGLNFRRNKDPFCDK